MISSKKLTLFLSIVFTNLVFIFQVIATKVEDIPWVEPYPQYDLTCQTCQFIVKFVYHEVNKKVIQNSKNIGQKEILLSEIFENKSICKLNEWKEVADILGLVNKDILTTKCEMLLEQMEEFLERDIPKDNKTLAQIRKGICQNLPCEIWETDDAPYKWDRLSLFNSRAVDDYAKKFSDLAGSIKHKSGLIYRYITQSTKPDSLSPIMDSKVKVHYLGRTLMGVEIDRSDSKPIELELTQIMIGWSMMLQIMKEGDKVVVFIPPELAYGITGVNNILGPNEGLVFDIELVEVVELNVNEKKNEESKLKKTTIIENDEIVFEKNLTSEEIKKLEDEELKRAYPSEEGVDNKNETESIFKPDDDIVKDEL